MQQDFVVVGAGISGLVASSLLLRAMPNARLTVIDTAPQAGGLLRGFVYEDANLSYDKGTHVFQMTGIRSLDNMFQQVLSDAYVEFAGAKRERAASFFNGRLYPTSGYISFIETDASSKIDNYMTAVRAAATLHSKPQPSEFCSARDYAEALFGRPLFEDYLEEIVQGRFSRDVSELSPLAIVLMNLQRVVLFPEAKYASISDNPSLRARIAIPDQSKLPPDLDHMRPSFYSSGGTSVLIDLLESDLRERGARFVLGRPIECIEPGKNKVTVSIGPNRLETITGQHLVWTAGMPGLYSQMTGSKLNIGRASRSHCLGNLAFSSPIFDTDITHINIFDNEKIIFRVTNYNGFDVRSKQFDRNRITVEYFSDATTSTGEGELRGQLSKVVHELSEISGKDARRLLSFASVERLSYGFPIPSSGMEAEIIRGLDELQGLDLRNIRSCGMFSEPGLFFQNDILKHLERQVVSLLNDYP